MSVREKETRVEKAKAQLVEQVEALLASGDVEQWHKPWVAFAQHAPTNGVSKHVYTGGNAFLFHLVAHQEGWVGYFATYKQWAEKGCQVRKGSTGLPGIFVKKIWVDDKDNPGEKKQIFLSRGFTVFAAEQVDGDYAQELIKSRQAPALTQREQDDAASSLAAKLIASHDKISLTGSAAFYVPGTDQIVLPPQDTFVGDVAYASTVAHEFVHWTGHHSRENRFGKDAEQIDGVGGFQESYAFEELIAELGAVFLLAEHGVSAAPQENSAAYLGGWLKRLRGDADFLWHAAARAQSAVAVLNKHLEGAAVAAPPVQGAEAA